MPWKGDGGVSDDLRVQLDVIAQLNKGGMTEEIRLALESWIQTRKSDSRVLERAETVRAEVECEAKTRQIAIEAIFGSNPEQGNRLALWRMRNVGGWA